MNPGRKKKGYIGVRNPFAVAELKLKKSISWKDKPFESRKKILEKVFGMPYSHLFSREYGSPLFCKEKIAVGGVSSCAPWACPSGTDVTWKPITGGVFRVGSTAYNDPVQGCCPDCYLVAALSSAAWMGKLRYTAFPADGKFRFYTCDGLTGTLTDNGPVQVSQGVPFMTASSSLIVHSRSFTSAAESWPSLYEKAFAAWKDSGNDTPDYSLICMGNPAYALAAVSNNMKFYGKDADPSSGLMKSIHYNADFSEPLKILQKIANHCSPAETDDNPGPNPKPEKKTLYPMVAWTYDNATKPAGVTYTEPTIVENHAYSVLGVRVTRNTTDKKINGGYIVLRNPYGQKSGDPALYDGTTLATGTWKPPLMSSVSLDDKTDGIFALHYQVFAQYFSGFAWVF